ncbi:hypothetical protein GF359_00475 [candidate division WOR-3 bacterium]|uniref:Uncharacterized protein n=1 Tax=candidate division WOR-3 bacterium TaxID=2052148 RepID=A0A9D5K7E3_UNCW3|nr:hypothetical protein [candidate division WOR-3 bacterium]MBD3363668.1 hypothetical protein [candidate division WOR-3 bacterium]
MNVKKVFTLALLGMLFIIGCDLIDQLKKGAYHTASRINSIQAIGSSKEFAFVDIEYIFTGTGVSGQKAVFGRSGSDKRDTMEIAVQSTVYYDTDTLSADTDYTYTLWLLDGTEPEDYDEIPVKTMPIIEIITPADTLTGETVELKWNKLTYEGEDYLTYEVAIYDGSGLDLSNPDLEALLALTDPLEDPQEVTLTESDTEGIHTYSINPPAILQVYVAKVTTKKGIGDKLANKSTAFKPFVWAPLAFQ